MSMSMFMRASVSLHLLALPLDLSEQTTELALRLVKLKGENLDANTVARLA